MQALPSKTRRRNAWSVRKRVNARLSVGQRQFQHPSSNGTRACGTSHRPPLALLPDAVTPHPGDPLFENLGNRRGCRFDGFLGQRSQANATGPDQVDPELLAQPHYLCRR